MPMSWDEYQKSIGWNNTDAVRGFQSIANNLGYSGPVQERTGRQISMGEGESGPMMTDEWGPAAGLSQALGGYQFGQGTDASGNPITQVYNADGSMRDSARVGSTGGSMMNFMSKAIPALTLAGFGAGAYGLLGGGGAAAAPAAGNGAFLGEAAWSPTAMAGADAAGGAVAGGGMLGQVGGMAGEAASWMKANPMLGKALMSGGMGLLSGAGGGGGGSAQAPTYAPATQWSSPIQQGIQSAPQQMNPAPIQQRPAGLLAQGQQNDGAWRFLGGK
jgi:hypothetical protein